MREGNAPLNFRGEFVTHTPDAADLQPRPQLSPAADPVGCTPRTRDDRTAAEVADAVLVMPFNSARHFAERTLPAVAEGLRRAGRRGGSDSRGDGCGRAHAGRTCGRHRRGGDADRVLRLHPRLPACVLEVEGWGDLQPQPNALSKSGGYAEMRALITPEMVASHRRLRHTPRRCGRDPWPVRCAYR